MALRLLPFRQYNETDVINLYAVLPTGTNSMDSPFTNGGNDNGVLVKVSNGDMNADPVTYDEGLSAGGLAGSYLGKTDYPFIGRDQYPSVPLKVDEADNGDDGVILGVTLRQTLTYDENGEKLLYNPQKAIEMQAVLSGQAVPVLTNGLVTLDQTAFSVEPTAVPSAVYPGAPGAGGGKLTKTQAASEAAVGVCIASGQRVARGPSSDYFAGSSVGTGAAGSDGKYYVVKLNCN